jgi:hypothetical protein
MKDKHVRVRHGQVRHGQVKHGQGKHGKDWLRRWQQVLCRHVAHLVSPPPPPPPPLFCFRRDLLPSAIDAANSLLFYAGPVAVGIRYRHGYGPRLPLTPRRHYPTNLPTKIVGTLATDTCDVAAEVEVHVR